jgi:FkbM family methyltransferase
MKSFIRYNNFQTAVEVFPGDPIGSAIINSGTFYEINFLEWILKNYPKHKLILDIGANIGNHSIFFANILKSDKVLAFEPVPVNIDKLKINTAGMNIEVKEYALSDEDGLAKVYNTQGFNFGGFTLEDEKFPNHTPVDVGVTINKITLDQLNLNDITMMKIDVENHELKVLEGARQTILRNTPIIFIENLNHGYPLVCLPDKFTNFFSSVNYELKESNIHGGFMDLWGPKN